jgi:hypothetical protein
MIYQFTSHFHSGSRIKISFIAQLVLHLVTGFTIPRVEKKKGPSLGAKTGNDTVSSK